MTLRHTLFATLAAGALVTLTACGGGTTQSSSEPSTAPAPATTTTAASAPPTESGSAASSDKPCEALTAAEVSEVIGAQVTEAKPSEIVGNHVCSYHAALGAPIVTSQISPLRGSVESNANAAFGPAGIKSTTPIDIPGAKDARVGEGSSGGAPMAGVIYAKGKSLHIVIVGVLEGDASTAKDFAVKAATAMAA